MFYLRVRSGVGHVPGFGLGALMEVALVFLLGVSAAVLAFLLGASRGRRVGGCRISWVGGGWLVARCLLFCCLSVVSVSAQSFTVVNIMGYGSLVCSNSTYPAGVSVFPLRAAPSSLVSALSDDFGISSDSLLSGSDFVASVSSSGVVSWSSSETRNYWSVFGAGMGLGLVWFGFGWVLRLNKKIPDF